MGGEEKQAQPDPTLVAQTAAAQKVDTKQVQEALGVDQQNLWNMFGTGTQLSYVQIPGSPAAAPGATSNTTGAPAPGAK